MQKVNRREGQGKLHGNVERGKYKNKLSKQSLHVSYKGGKRNVLILRKKARESHHWDNTGDR